MSSETLSFLSPFAGGTSVGVAIEVPEPHANALRELREWVEGAPPVEIIGPHITLVPPTLLPSYDLTDVEAQLARAARAVAPFSVVLAGSGTFRPTTQVVYAALAEGGQQCEALQTEARRGPLEQELRFAYHPHVTVAQDVTDERLDAAEDALSRFHAAFEVTEFVLYELGPDGIWHTIRRFELTGRRGRST